MRKLKRPDRFLHFIRQIHENTIDEALQQVMPRGIIIHARVYWR